MDEAVMTNSERSPRGIYDSQPAERWEDAFLSGNGLYGLLVFGDPLNETVMFNDHRFVYPDDQRREAPRVTDEMARLQDRLLAGEYRAGLDAFMETLQAKGWPGLLWTQPYHPGYAMHIALTPDGPISGYRRLTNFETGEIVVQWHDNRGDWVRKSFVSRDDNVIVQSLTAPSQGKINGSIRLDGQLDYIPAEMTFSYLVSPTCLNVRGKYPTRGGYEGVTRVVVSGGSVHVDNGTYSIVDADAVLLLTRLERYQEADQWEEQALQRQLAEIAPDYETLLQRHVALHQTIYNRVRVDFNGDPDERKLATSDLIAKQLEHPQAINLALLEKVFDAGRYHFLCASGYYPPRLPGIWQGDWHTPWQSDFTTDANVNLQVAQGDIGAMPEAMQGYFNLIQKIIRDWQTNATTIYGCRGILAPPRTDGENGLLFHFNWDYPLLLWIAGADWLLLPLYEHYLVTGDVEFLRTQLWPWLEQLALFYEDFLTRIDADGRVIFVPSYSPENVPANTGCPATINATMDIAAARHALQAAISISRDLEIEQEPGQGVARWTALLERLPAYRINERGALAEWSWPGLEDNYDHRHISHLYGVWPAQEINPEETPELAQAARTALELRLAEGGQAHGYLHRALVQARLKDGADVYSNMRALLTGNYFFRSLMTSHNPDLEIYNADTACTFPAILIEMLVDSRPGVLELLPALPDQLARGSISGIKGRNRLTVVELRWNLAHGRIDAVLRSDVTQTITLICRRGISTIAGSGRFQPSSWGAHARMIEMQAGEDVRIEVEM